MPAGGNEPAFLLSGRAAAEMGGADGKERDEGMQKILYENLRGERTELCGPPYLLEHVTGLGATDAEIVTTQGARQSGVTTRRASRGKRIVKAKIAIYGAGTRREMYELRRELCRKLALRQCFDERTGEMGRLMYENDAGAYWAYALPETPAEDGTRFLNHLNAMTLSFQCDSPYLSEFTQNRRVLRRSEGGLTMPFSFPIRLGVTAFAAECENAGAVDAPVDIEIEGSGEKPEIINETTGAVTYNTQTTTNTYNAAGKRLKRVEEDKTTRFYYMGEALLFTTNQDLVMTSENVLNTGGQIIASKRFAVPGVEVTDPFAGQYYFYRYDVRGSVTDILDKNAGLVKGYDYDEFGNTEEKGNENFLNDVTFTGSVSDASSGLQYMNARFYQPSTGRFLSQDSYTGNPYDPWTQHLYSYCGNNPVNMVDPTGHTIQEIQKESIRIRKDKARYEKLVADSGALMSKYYNRNFKEYIWNRNIYYYN